MKYPVWRVIFSLGFESAYLVFFIMRSILVLLILLFLSACDGNTPLMKASSDGAYEQIEGLLTDGKDINETNNYGWTALSHAARSGSVETAKLLIEKGAKVDIADDVGWTPLIRAAQKGNTPMVRFLIEKGADVNALTVDEWSSLMWATLRGKIATIKYLVSVDGINVNHLAKDGRSAILIAITENNNDALIILQDAGARP